MMRKLLSLGIMLCLLQPVWAQDEAAKIDSLITAFNRIHQFNGSALVARQGTVLLDKGYGYKNVANKQPNAANSIFQLGSITKQFTSAVILKLQEEKKLSVNDPVSKYFPDFPKGDSITIHQLLTHTAGIFNYTNDRRFMENEVSIPKSREQMMALFKDKPLDFSPGSSWNYSNSGYSLLGYIIEAATGKSYEQVVRQYLFAPAKMTHSGFDFTNLKNINKTTGYFAVNDRETKVAPIVDSTVAYAAGSIYATTGDLYNWHKALQKNIVLTNQQQELAYTVVKRKYGYGWSIDSIAGKRRVGHNGGIHGYITSFSRVPQDDVCIVLLSNASDKSLDDIKKGIYAILYNQPYELPKERKSVVLPDATLQQYVGEYEIQPGLNVVISVKGTTLSVAPTGQSEKTVLAEKTDVFFDTEDDVQIEFTRDAQNKVDGFILLQRGRKMVCKKIK